ncbi:hypothetical protein [Cellulomonas sp. P24]|uniref:hypothetical protein n=1 Tax=Cellulomonas sp. P24 TaxID=2885206 RepID=UPI00216B3EE8|nr:hypothetical protein [Cellulomonas sp. P24]MCR6494242.1 hypothetical protein [Cellulomonas sp. P24]
MKRITRLTVVLPVLLIAGCSIESAPTSNLTETSKETPVQTAAPVETVAPSALPTLDEASLDAAVRAYSAAFFAGDATEAFATLSARCAAKTDLSTYTGNLMAVQLVYKDAIPTLETVEVTVNGDSGVASYTYSDHNIDVLGQPWRVEDGAWRYDMC